MGSLLAQIFAATTLLVVLGTSVLTSVAGLSLALGAFLAGLLIAETEYALQVHGRREAWKGRAVTDSEGDVERRGGKNKSHGGGHKRQRPLVCMPRSA